MSRLYDNELYMADVKLVAGYDLPWEKIQNKNIYISGATGMIGSFLVDVLMEKNKSGLQCNVYALGRSEKRFADRFDIYANSEYSHFVEYDAAKEISFSETVKPDFLFHLASNTHPLQYSTDPIGTITTNVIALQRLLEYASGRSTERFVFASSNEIYGENRGDVELFDENYCGYINSNTLRAGYPESKRCGETLCQAYKSQKGLDVVIPRLTRSYGPTMLMSDTKAISQFIKKAINDEDIVLKSEGMQYYSYTYVADAVYGLLTVLFKGENGEAYNIADVRSDIRLKDLAGEIAGTVGKKVVFELPDTVERAGYSTATKARLDGTKLQRLGWMPQYTIQQGIGRTISILKNISSDES